MGEITERLREVEAIRARHKSAQPKPAVNPAWANAERDIGTLLLVIDDLERALKHVVDEKEVYDYMFGG